MATAAEEAQALQQGLTSLMLLDVENSWPLLDPNDMSGTLDPYILSVYSTVTQYGNASGVLGSRFYEKQRQKAGVHGRHKSPIIDLPRLAALTVSLRWALKDLWDAPDSDPEPIKALVGGIAQRNVVNTARSTIVNAVHLDRQAKGWAREAKPDACSFCLLLAIRGPVYKTQTTASVQLNGDPYHDHCHCLPVPLFRDQSYQAPEYVKEAAALYTASTHGMQGPEKARAFRRAVKSTTT